MESIMEEKVFLGNNITVIKKDVDCIAGKVGYNNPSKFAAAFKEIMGMPPAKYQKNYV